MILIDPDRETVEAKDITSEAELLKILHDEDADTLPFGRMLAFTGKSSLRNPDYHFVRLPDGNSLTVPLRGPVIIMPQAGYVLNDMIINRLIDDLSELAAFYRPVRDKTSGKWLLEKTDGSQVIDHPVLADCLFR